MRSLLSLALLVMGTQVWADTNNTAEFQTWAAAFMAKEAPSLQKTGTELTTSIAGKTPDGKDCALFVSQFDSSLDYLSLGVGPTLASDDTTANQYIGGFVPLDPSYTTDYGEDPTVEFKPYQLIYQTYQSPPLTNPPVTTPAPSADVYQTIDITLTSTGDVTYATATQASVGTMTCVFK